MVGYGFFSSSVAVSTEVMMRNIFSLSNNEECDKSTTFLSFKLLLFMNAEMACFSCVNLLFWWGAKLLISVKR